jgi:DNA mismatch endonuclease (patch repair protein)
VLPKYRAAIFVNGCFWHAHKGCSYFRLPKTRTEFWREKLAKNVERDQKTTQALIASGWRVMTVWECATKRLSLENLLGELAEWLRGPEISGEIPIKREVV